MCEKDAEKNIIRERIPDMIDCAIVIGGDGSLIEVARTFWKRDFPILGINMGTLAYLSRGRGQQCGRSCHTAGGGRLFDMKSV